MDKRQIRRIADQLLPSFTKRFLFTLRGRINQSRSTSDIFSQIYSSGRWGGDGKFDSGTGTADESVVDPYVVAVRSEIEKLGLSGARFVDLGCGDFRVGQKIAPLSGSYTGVDIVPALVKHLEQSHGRDDISFRCINMIEDPLPDGDVCFVRQVLQHLSNDQILKILPKLAAYKYVFVTEHIPNRSNPIRRTSISLTDRTSVFIGTREYSLNNDRSPSRSPRCARSSVFAEQLYGEAKIPGR